MPKAVAPFGLPSDRFGAAATLIFAQQRSDFSTAPFLRELLRTATLNYPCDHRDQRG
jgi:hypothetical protein